jgi:hypothetical protein
MAFRSATRRSQMSRLLGVVTRSLPLVLIFAAAPTAASSQETVVLREGCAACRIQLDAVVRLSDDALPGVANIGSKVARDSRGRWFLGSDLHPQIAVFDSTGGFIGAVGRRGKGPGEFQSIRHFYIGPGDTLVVYDNALLRRSIHAPDLRHVRVDPMPGSALQVQPLPSGGALLNAHIATPQRVGHPLHVLDRQGRIVRSFGGERAVVRPAQGMTAASRRIAVGRDGSIWTAFPWRYEIVERRSNGEAVRTLRREVGWLPNSDGPSRYPAPANPQLNGLWIDSAANLLWVVATVPDPAYKAPPSPGPASQQGIDAMLDLRIEVIDLSTREVLAGIRLPDVLYGFTSDGFLLRLDENTARVHVLRPTLHRR